MKNYLTQAMIKESINRLADAARTVEDFEGIVTWLDAFDERWQDAYNKKMKQFDADVFEWLYYRSTRFDEEDIVSLLHTCICQMHNLIEDAAISALINKATDKQKRVFFLRVIRGCSPQKIAVCLGMTDRNVRDLMDKMVTKIQKGLFDLLTKRNENKESLTGREIRFLNAYKTKIGVKQ